MDNINFDRRVFKAELHGRLIKSRMGHKCDLCMGTIEKGEVYDFSDGISPTFTNEMGERVRGKYWVYRTHAFDCYTPEECLLGNHRFKEYAPNFNDLIPGDYETRCEECGLLKE